VVYLASGKEPLAIRDYRTIDDITEEYLRNHPEEVDDYITELFEEYAQDGDIVALLSSLRVISRVYRAILS
jgi:HTH-type transcriptional regulator / antitoxin HigA